MLHSETNSEALIGEAPVLVRINSIPFWKSSGRTFPEIAGAEDPPGGTDSDTDKDADKDKKPDGGGDEFDKDRALATIRTQREKEQKLEAELKELRPLKAKLKALDDAEKSEADRLREQVAELERKATATERELQEARNRRAVERAAAKAGAADAEDVFRLLDHAEFEHDDEGNITNADELVKALLKAKPYLAGSNGEPQTRPGVPPTPRSSGQPKREEKIKENEEKLIATRKYTPFG